MWGLIPLLLIGGIPAVRVDDRVCSKTTMAEAFHVLRPMIKVRPGTSEDPNETQISLERIKGLLVVKVRRGGELVVRSFVDPGDCNTTAQTAALIADGALDDLPEPTTSVTLEPAPPSLGPPPWVFSIGLGLGGRQSILGGASALQLSVSLERGIFLSQLTFEGSLPTTRDMLPRSQPFLGTGGSWVASSMTPLLAEGVIFQAGPGRLSVQGEAGVELTFLSVTSSLVVRQQDTRISEPFLGLRVAYAFELPNHLYLEPSLEERIAPALARFQVEGIPAHVTTRTWTLAGALTFGFRIF